VKWQVFLAFRVELIGAGSWGYDAIGDFRRRLRGHEQRARREDPEVPVDGSAGPKPRSAA